MRVGGFFKFNGIIMVRQLHLYSIGIAKNMFFQSAIKIELKNAVFS